MYIYSIEKFKTYCSIFIQMVHNDWMDQFFINLKFKINVKTIHYLPSMLNVLFEYSTYKTKYHK